MPDSDMTADVQDAPDTLEPEENLQEVQADSGAEEKDIWAWDDNADQEEEESVDDSADDSGEESAEEDADQ